MAKMTLKEIISNIRKSVWARDVRESIAQGMEYLDEINFENNSAIDFNKKIDKRTLRIKEKIQYTDSDNLTPDLVYEEYYGGSYLRFTAKERPCDFECILIKNSSSNNVCNVYGFDAEKKKTLIDSVTSNSSKTIGVSSASTYQIVIQGQGPYNADISKFEFTEYIDVFGVVDSNNDKAQAQSKALQEQGDALKHDLGDLTNTIISVEKSNITENIDNYENIESTIIKSNGKLESNSYTTRFIVQKYTNLAKGSYVVKGFCQGDQCLYVLCDKNGGVIKYEDSTSQGSSGTKTVDISIDEHNTMLYVGGYETVTAVVKKYLYDTKLTTKFSNIYMKKVTLNGDSIAFGAGTGGTGFMDYIATKYNMTLDKKAVSGATIANLSSRYPDKHCICTSIDTMAEDANYIIFEGGYNDWLLWTQIGTLTDTMSGDLDDTKFYGALESICRQALAKWENGKIGFIITHKINDAWRTQKQEGGTYPTLDGYYQAIKDVCEKYSIPYLDLSKVSRLNTELQNYKKYTYNSDGVHPTKDGYQIFYVNTITRWMENL